MGTSVQSVEVGKFNFRTLVKNYLDLTKLPIVLLLLFTTVTTMVIAAHGIPTLETLIPTLIVGAFAERIRFSAVLAFMVLWFTFAYVPIAHMVWYWAGPDAYTDAAAGAAATAHAGFLFQRGALDFAGGTVVHINAGIAGLVGAILTGKRSGYGQLAIMPHNLPMVMIGASLLWVGWFGFNVGSNLEASGFAGQVFANSFA